MAEDETLDDLITPVSAKLSAVVEDDEGDDLDAFVVDRSESRGLAKPWMKFHKFTLVKTVDEVRQIVDDAIANGSCGLDLETEGFDNRVNFDENGKPSTVHQIVGFCVSVRGHGYYIPVRHVFDDFADKNPNVLPISGVEAEISRLCWASQPVLTEEGLATDPLGSPKLVAPPKVVIGFWLAKFDQEFLYPVTGLEIWHPESFQCGHLAAFTVYSDDDDLGLKGKAYTNLTIYDPDVLVEGKPKAYPYEMIEFKELFEPGCKDRRFYNLYPTDTNEVTLYGCSDAICTELLCFPKTNWDFTRPGLTYDYREVVSKALAPSYSFTHRLEKQTVAAVRDLERQRVKIDHPKVSALNDRAIEEQGKYDRLIRDLAEKKGFKDFNAGSPQQLSDFLFGDQGLNISPKPEKNEASGFYKTDAATLERLAEEVDAPVLDWIVKYRQISKIMGTYLASMAANCDSQDQLRFKFNQTGAATGRFTAPSGEAEHGYSGVPPQGIPGRSDPKKPEVAHSLRTAFIAREGYTLVKVDYAGQELRVVANLSGEELWIKEFLTGTGDLHTLTAQAFFGAHITKKNKAERDMGKCVHPDTLLFSQGRYQKISDLGEFPSQAEAFSDAPEDVTVFNGSEQAPVRALYNGGSKQLIHVVTSGGLLTCTENHRFKLVDGLVRAGDLKEGDLLEPVSIPQMLDQDYPNIETSLWEGIPTSTYKVNQDWAYLAGAYAGDGSGTESCATLCHGEKTHIDAYGTPYSEWIANLQASCQKCGLKSTVKDGLSLYLGSTVLVRLFKSLGMFGKRSKTFRVPWWVLQAGRSAFLSYFGGLIDTDGTVGTAHAASFCTNDYVFAGQLALCLRACGLDFNVHAAYNKTYDRYYIELDFTVASSWELKPYLRHPGKIARLRAPQQPGATRNRFEVRKVLKGPIGPCLDVSLGTEDHLYVANGLLTHNTANFALIYGGGPASIMRATKCNKVEAARRKANFDKAVPTFANWVKGQHAKVKKNLGVYNAFGRFLAIPDANLKAGDLDAKGNPISEKDARMIRAACERKSTNYPIQGCYQAGALILTKEGWRKIETPGTCEVWTGTRWATSVAKDMGTCDLAELRLSDGTRISCDTRHKLLVVTEEGYTWVEFADLKPGMAIATPLHEPVEFTAKKLPPIPHRAKAQVTFKVSAKDIPELWYWLGRYYGDGWLDYRGALVYTFGRHEGSAVDRCLAYWRRLGFNPTLGANWKDTQQGRTFVYAVTIWSVDLMDWLGQLGISPATAKTKRLPLRVLNETLVNRKQFILGFMDSDGHKPKLPKKVEGVWETNKKGNPYNFHLCQRPLLVDLKLLLRSLGVESIIRGPYRNGKGKKGPTTSYRLDLNRRMFDRHVLGVSSARLPKFNDMFVPKFLVDELLAYDFHREDFGSDESAAVMYYRLKVGGKITVYAFQHLCRLLGVSLTQPLYGFKRLVLKACLPDKATTYTQSVSDPLHRFEAEGVVAKNSGADILKISLVKLIKEFHRRGWRRQGGDDSVRMILTVHDEIVFEIKHHRLAEAVPVIVEIMESPSKLAKWKVPLIVEPLLGLTWDAKYDWYHIMEGKDPVPPWLEGILVPNTAKPEAKELPVTVAAPTPVSPVQAPLVSEIAQPEEPPMEPETSLMDERPTMPSASSLPGTYKVAVFTLPSFLTLRSAKLTLDAIFMAMSPQSNIFVKVVDGQGNVLVDPSEIPRFRVDPDELKIRLRDRSLGGGAYELRDEAL